METGRLSEPEVMDISVETVFLFYSEKTRLTHVN